MYEIFRRLLQENNLTAYKVSKETGVAQATLSDWKTGKSTPKLDKLEKIAAYLNVSVDYLLGKIDEPKINKEKDDNEIVKFALWQSDASEVDDEMLQDVKEYAKMRMKLKKQKKSDDNGK